MAGTALVYGDVFLRHETGFHSDNKKRVSFTYNYLRSRPIHKKIIEIAPLPADARDITLVHTKAYCDAILSLPGDQLIYLDPDTVFGPGSLDAALNAVGAVKLAVDRVLAGAIRSAFCMVRPPGHHARPSRAMGFCIFNNVAIGAAYATRVCGLERVAIIDFDVHHGNGTQEMFYASEDVLYCSIHQWPFYPGTGTPDQIGEGKGRGKTINVPLVGGSTEDDYMEALSRRILPAVRDHRPAIIFLSAGFDAHEADPIGGMCLTTESYRRITGAIAEVAGESCEGRMISALEGGYNLDALAASVEAHIEALAD